MQWASGRLEPCECSHSRRLRRATDDRLYRPALICLGFARWTWLRRNKTLLSIASDLGTVKEEIPAMAPQTCWCEIRSGAGGKVGLATVAQKAIPTKTDC